MYKGTFELAEESKPIRDIAYDRLKHAIITGELPAGSRIVETTYAEQLHISRTPLREALRKLERDGLVEYVLRHGVVVRAFTVADIEEIFTIRNAMMMLILPSAVANATPKDIAELRVLLSEMDVAQKEEDADEEYILRFSAITIASIVRRSKAHQEHHQMVDLLEKHDLEGMEKLMAHHLEESKQTCLAAVANRK